MPKSEKWLYQNGAKCPLVNLFKIISGVRSVEVSNDSDRFLDYLTEHQNIVCGHPMMPAQTLQDDKHASPCTISLFSLSCSKLVPSLGGNLINL